MNEGIMTLASQGRYGDQMMAHVAPGEVILPKKLVADPELKKQLEELYEKFGVTMDQYTVGNEANSINPNTGIMEFGFLSDLWKGIKKNAPTIGHIVGFAFGGPIGATIGGAVGGAVKEGDLGYAAKQAATGFALGNIAAGAGLTGGTLSSPSLGFGAGGVSGTGVGGFFQNIGANARGALTGAMPTGATSIGSSFKGLTGMEKGLAGLTAITAMGGFEPVEETGEPLPQVPGGIANYMNAPLGSSGPIQFTPGPTQAGMMMNNRNMLVPVQEGIENSALLNYLESQRRKPVTDVAFPSFEVV